MKSLVLSTVAAGLVALSFSSAFAQDLKPLNSDSEPDRHTLDHVETAGQADDGEDADKSETDSQPGGRSAHRPSLSAWQSSGSR